MGSFRYLIGERGTNYVKNCAFLLDHFFLNERQITVLLQCQQNQKEQKHMSSAEAKEGRYKLERVGGRET